MILGGTAGRATVEDIKPQPFSDLRAYDPARLAGTIKRKTDVNDRQMRSAIGRLCSVLFFLSFLL